MNSFVWDADKEAINIQKHGVNFTFASRVFADPNIRIMKDSSHSKKEDRLYCFGKVDGKILTVRFLYREGKIRIFGAGYWRKGRKYYEEKEIT